jgi:hypothetical protein
MDYLIGNVRLPWPYEDDIAEKRSRLVGELEALLPEAKAPYIDIAIHREFLGPEVKFDPIVQRWMRDNLYCVMQIVGGEQLKSWERDWLNEKRLMMQCPELTEAEKLSIHPDDIVAWWVDNCPDSCSSVTDEGSDSTQEHFGKQDEDTKDL